VAVLDLWAPWPPGIWTGPSTNGSSYFTNPWSTEDNPACDVWIQLTAGTNYTDSGSYYNGFGILEVEFIGPNGIQQTIYGDVNNLSNVEFPVMPVILFQTNLVSFTVGWAAPSYYGCIYPTLMRWG
jgi:hypothetical protein